MKNNWGTKKLIEISEVFSDGDWIEKKDQSKEGIRLVQTGNVGNGYFKDRVEKARYISEKTFYRLNCTEIKKGDCLVSRLPDPVGRACILPNTGEKMITAVDCTIIRFKDDILPQWFIDYSLSQEYQVQINKEVGGATRQRVSRSNLGQIQIPLPALTEQKRIIKILEEVFVKVGEVKENAEKNLQNSRELFESYLQDTFARPGKDWELKNLGDVCKVIGGGTPSKAKANFYGGDIPWATVRDMKYEIIKETEHKITADAVKNSSTNIITKGNVIIATRVGLGKVCLIENDTAINQDLRGIIPKDPKELTVGYLFLWLKSVAHIIKEEGTGATVLGVKLPFIKSLVIPIPPLTEQKEIVKNLNSLYAETKKLQKIYKEKLANLEELNKSVLGKAFNAEL